MSPKGIQKKALRSIGHHLHPVVQVAEKGLSEGLVKESSRALQDHELIKIRFDIDDRDTRKELMQELATQLDAEIVQIIGKIGLFYRPSSKPNPKLSNLLRYTEV